MTAKVWLRASITAVLLAVASTASAQQSISSSDIQRLQDQVYQAGSEVTRLRSARFALRHVGVDPDSVTFIQVGSTPERFVALRPCTVHAELQHPLF